MIAELHELISVTETEEADCFLAQVDLTDMTGERSVLPYVARKGDTFGLAPQVWGAITAWIADGKPVLPAPPPEPEPLVPLSPRQIRLALNSIQLTEADVEAALAGNPDGLVEWRWATRYDRDHPLVVSLATHFNLPSEQIDTLWRWAQDL